MSEKPLHIQVAEALGWTEICLGGKDVQPQYACDWFGKPPAWDKSRIPDYKHSVPDYTIDWRETGPLIEKYEITVGTRDGIYWAHRQKNFQNAAGPTPLIAICNLLLDLHKAGKLNPCD